MRNGVEKCPNHKSPDFCFVVKGLGVVWQATIPLGKMVLAAVDRFVKYCRHRDSEDRLRKGTWAPYRSCESNFNELVLPMEWPVHYLCPAWYDQDCIVFCGLMVLPRSVVATITPKAMKPQAAILRGIR